MVTPKVTWVDGEDDGEQLLEDQNEVTNINLETDSDDKIFDKDDKSPENTQKLEELLNPSGTGLNAEPSPIASSLQQNFVITPPQQSQTMNIYMKQF